jgi:hypothetical protein
VVKQQVTENVVCVVKEVKNGILGVQSVKYAGDVKQNKKY